MTRIAKKVFAGVLSLAFVVAVSSQASAQHWRRDRDRDYSNGQRAAIIAGGAAAGAVIGGLLGGKKGALIGGAIGGGAGTGTVILHDRNNDDDGFYRGRYENRNWRDNDWRARSWRERELREREWRHERFERNRWRH